MKILVKIKNFFIKSSLLKKIFLAFGFLLLILGIVFIIFSSMNEVLDDKYIITKSTEYKKMTAFNLKPGEIGVLKSINYEEKGIYKVTYWNDSKSSKNRELIENNSYLTITEELGKGYELVKDDIYINDKDYKLNENTLKSKEGVNINYIDNCVNIEIPSSLVSKKNEITFHIKLISRDVSVKHNTTIDSYYGFIPASSNSFYEKKSRQSYIIEGNGYIVLKNR